MIKSCAGCKKIMNKIKSFCESGDGVDRVCYTVDVQVTDTAETV